MSETNDMIGSSPADSKDPIADSQKAPASENQKSTSDAPSRVHGLITSKRVVIPPDAKRVAAKAPAVTPATKLVEDSVSGISTEPRIVEESPGEQMSVSADQDVEIPTTAPAEPTLTKELGPDSGQSEPPTQVQEHPSPVLITAQVVTICPFLGLITDPGSRFAEPSASHRCFSPKKPGAITIDYQSEFCFSEIHSTCVRFDATVAAKDLSIIAPPDQSGFVPDAQSLSKPAETPITVEPAGHRRGRLIEIALWAIAAIVGIIAIISIVPIFLPNMLGGLTQTSQSVPTTVSIAAPTGTPEPSVTVEATLAPTRVLAPTLVPLVIPTPPENGSELTLLPDSQVSGWAADNETQPHWNDPNLFAGSFQGKHLESIVQFNLANLPPESKVIFAALELTGRDASGLGKDGQWQVEMLEPRNHDSWILATANDFESVAASGTVGSALDVSQLSAGNLNRFVFSAPEMQLLEKQFSNGEVAFRIKGSNSSGDSLFAWEAGGGTSTLRAPQLHLVVLPGKYVVVTNTPEPTNVLTAAAYLVRGTEAARKNGTPTSFPPGFATATPGGELVLIDSSTAVPQNVSTASARSAIATAVALTTGTYTPTSVGVVVIFPTNTPVLQNPEDLTTPTPTRDRSKLAGIVIPPQYQGKIFALSTFFGDQDGAPIAISPEGELLGRFTGTIYYQAADYREQFSVSGNRLIYPNDSRGIQQIAYQDANSGETVFLTRFAKGIAYDAAWSPDGNSVVFVGTETNGDEIYTINLGDKAPKCVTCGTTDPNLLPFNKHPSFSPDGQRIVFWSSRSGQPQVWVINRDGSNLLDISDGRSAETNPVWVK